MKVEGFCVFRTLSSCDDQEEIFVIVVNSSQIQNTVVLH